MTEAAKRTPTDSSGVVFGWGAPAMADQHPILNAAEAEHFDKDSMAIIRLSIRGLITDSQKQAAFKKLTHNVGKAIREALAARPLPRKED